MTDSTNDFTVSYCEVYRSIEASYLQLCDAAYKLAVWDKISGENHLAQVQELRTKALSIQQITHRF